MNHREISLIATFKTADAFGDKYAADFPDHEEGGKQFARVKTAVTATADLGATQVSADEDKHGGVLDEAALRLKLHDDLLAISKAAHSLTLLGTTGLDGKFHMPRSQSDQALLNAARAFATDAAPFQAQFVSLKLATTFIADLNDEIDDFEKAIKAKGSGGGKKAGATGGLRQTIHDAGIALHVLNTVVPLDSAFTSLMPMATARPASFAAAHRASVATLGTVTALASNSAYSSRSGCVWPVGMNHTHSGYPGTNASGKTARSAPAAPASAMSRHAFAMVASRSM